MNVSGKIIVSLLTASLFVSVPTENLVAHDFWIEPSMFQASVGEAVELTLRVGQDFRGDSVPYITDWFSDYRVVGPQAEYPIKAVNGDDPAGEFIARAPGIYSIGYRSTQNFVEIGPAKFRKYLEDEGLDDILIRLARSGEDESAGREIYSRCAKSLIKVDNPESSAGFDTVFGYTLELIPERNPYGLAPGQAMPLRLIYDSQPLEGALVIAFTSDRPEKKLTARTDDQGRVRLRLPHSGDWLVKAVHMIEAPTSETRADWESFWASLTFRLPAAPE